MQAPVSAAGGHKENIFKVFFGQFYAIRHQLLPLIVAGTAAGFGIKQIAGNAGVMNGFVMFHVIRGRGFYGIIIVDEFVQATLGAAIADRFPFFAAHVIE